MIDDNATGRTTMYVDENGHRHFTFRPPPFVINLTGRARIFECSLEGCGAEMAYTNPPNEGAKGWQIRADGAARCPMHPWKKE